MSETPLESALTWLRCVADSAWVGGHRHNATVLLEELERLRVANALLTCTAASLEADCASLDDRLRARPTREQALRAIQCSAATAGISGRISCPHESPDDCLDAAMREGEAKQGGGDNTTTERTAT